MSALNHISTPPVSNPDDHAIVAATAFSISPLSGGSSHGMSPQAQPQPQPSSTFRDGRNRTRRHRRVITPIDNSSISTAAWLLLFGFATLLRILVGFHPHSGQDNYHGSQTAYGGDYEAQKHWMELTIHLPIGDWYWHDLDYWGLDYPPLTAYISWICGWCSYYMVGPYSVALYESRGLEDNTQKAFLRATVLVLDLTIYGAAVWFSTYNGDKKSLWAAMIALVQPAIILIDHGHFQYNTVALGLSIAAFSYMVQESFDSCVWGGFFFVLALNFKQMTLYYAPVVFFYLLGRCFSRPTWFLFRILWLGIVVLLTFYALWEPFVKYAPSHDPTLSHLERLEHVLRRIFPFQRGLFEGKVSNLWCALNTSPINIRDRIPTEQQPMLSLVATAILMLPSCLRVLTLGCHEPNTVSVCEKHWNFLLWATMSCALSFFLASFQVHEKSILIVLAPCTLLLWQDPIFVEWLSFVSVWTLYPLLQVDRLQSAYVCIVTIFACLVWFRRMGMGQLTVPTVFSGNIISDSIPFLTYLTMIGLHLAQALVPPPADLPDLYEVLWSVAGCAMFLLAWIVTIGKLYFSKPVILSPNPHNNVQTKAKVD